MKMNRIVAFLKGNTKRTMTLLVCLALLFTCVSAIAVAAIENEAQAAAKIGDKSYEEFQDALTAASDMTGEVTVEIYEKVTLNTSLNGSYDSITFVGKDTDAEIYLEVQGYITATGKNVGFEDLILSKSAGGFIGNAGFMNVAFGIYDVESVTYTDCVFANGSFASSGVVTYSGCTFKRSHDKYGLWAYGDVVTTVEDCVFDDYRGIKMYAEGAAKTVDLTVINTDFSAVSDKPAIVLTYGESVTLAGNTYSDTGVFELDLGGSPNGTPITSSDAITCVNDNGECGVIVTDSNGNAKIYTTVADAATAGAAAGNCVLTLLHDTEEIVALPAGVALNSNGYTAGNVTVDATTPEFNPVVKIGEYAYYDSLTAALKALKADDVLTLLDDITIAEDWDNRYTGAKISVPVTIDGNGHTLKFTGKVFDGYNYLSAFRFEAAATVKDLTMDLSESISGWGTRMRAVAAKCDITVDNCTFIGNTAHTNSNAIIFGEGADTASLNASITNCKFANWKNGVSDEQGAKDTAKTVVISNSNFDFASVNVSATENVEFTGNTMDESWVTVKSYTNADNLTVTATGNTLAENTEAKSNSITANPANITTDDDSLKPVAKLGESSYYASFAALVENLTVDGKIVLTADLQLFDPLTLPEDATFNGNGYVVSGQIVAGGDLTFEGYTKVTGFNAGYDKPTITIGEGATLETTSGRIVIGHGATFNITGTVADAKTADISSLTPSLIAPGASFTGVDVDFNVTNAYIKFTAYASSKNSSANGEFNFNLNNSVWEQTGSLVFSEPTNGKDPTFNFSLEDSVLNSTSHLVFAVAKGNIVVDNSNVNGENAAKQLEIRSTMTVKNGSLVYASDATSSNAKKPGTLIVDGATYVGSGEYSGSDAGIGTLILRNGANVALGKISNTNAYKDSTSTLTYTAIGNLGNVNIYDVVDYAFALTTDKTALKATESLNATVSINAAYYSAEYTFTYDATKFSCEADTDNDGVIYVTNLYKGDAGDLATYTLVAKNDINSVSEGNMLTVSGDAIQYKEQLLNGVENVVTGDAESIKISLNYTCAVKADYVSGYSLVLVYGNDAGYAYDGVKMYYVEAYGAYAVLVKGAVTDGDIDVALAKAQGCETIAQSYDVNSSYVADGKVDLKDATAVYACSVLDFAVADYMGLFLRADVNGDYVVNMIDINAVTLNYTE